MRSLRNAAFAHAACLLALACAPQIVDAVDEPVAEPAGGSGGAGSGGTGAAGSGGSGAIGGGGGQPCVGTCCEMSTEDRDGDGTPDCDDDCPDQPDKVEPGLCGCDVPDEDRPDLPSCVALLEGLLHRYSFEGTGTVVSDTVANVVSGAAPADGVLFNVALNGSGRVNLAGGMNGSADDDQYVALPSGLLSGLQSVTLEAWLIWYGGLEWQRIFDFGNNDSDVPGLQGSVGTSYLFLTPDSGTPGNDRARVAYKRSDYPKVEIIVDSGRLFPVGVQTHVAVTFDHVEDRLALYFDGALEGALDDVAETTGVPLRLDMIEDIYGWIGRSQFGADAELAASIDEFRIYSVALSAAQLRTSRLAGPNPSFFR